MKSEVEGNNVKGVVKWYVSVTNSREYKRWIRRTEHSFVCAPAHVFMCVHIHMESRGLCLMSYSSFSTLVFETRLFPESRAHTFSWTDWIVSSRDPSVFASLGLGLQVCNPKNTGMPKYPFPLPLLPLPFPLPHSPFPSHPFPSFPFPFLSCLYNEYWPQSQICILAKKTLYKLNYFHSLRNWILMMNFQICFWGFCTWLSHWIKCKNDKGSISDKEEVPYRWWPEMLIEIHTVFFVGYYVLIHKNRKTDNC